jgi:hypothetical protein
MISVLTTFLSFLIHLFSLSCHFFLSFLPIYKDTILFSLLHQVYDRNVWMANDWLYQHTNIQMKTHIYTHVTIEMAI